MTVQEIAEKLKQEFPFIRVDFDIAITSIPPTNLRPYYKSEIEITIYTNHMDIGHIECSSLEEGVKKLHAALNVDDGPKAPSQEISFNEAV